MKATQASSSTPIDSTNSLGDAPGEQSESIYFDDFLAPSLDGASGINLIFDLFQYSKHTFQYIKTDARTNKQSAPVRIYTSREEALADATLFNGKGYDVYFMVNEGDGIIHAPHKTPRSQDNIHHLSRSYIDTDNCPLKDILNYLSHISLTPHLIIESSPSRFHIYFFFGKTEKTPENIAIWKAVQSMLMRLGNDAALPRTDASMVDYAKVLRVPGFTHIKKHHVVSIYHQNDIPYYTLGYLSKCTKAYLFQEVSNKTEVSLETDDPIIPGERFAALQQLSMKLANENTDKEIAFQIFEEFIRTRLDNTDSVYFHNDEVTDKSLALFNSAFGKIKREETQRIQVLQSTLEEAPKPNPWALPDSFYLSAPNGFGDVIKQVMDYSLYPCASLAFGTFITGLSILKSKTHLTPTGSSTALYTLNIAPTGYGKNAPMSLLQNTFVSIGCGALISNEVRSDRGVYNHLSGNQGTGILILDEIAPLLHAIQQKDATSHLANIAKAFLQLYSSGSIKGISLGKVSTSNTKKGEPEIVLNNPMIAICGYTVPSQFFSLFSASSVAEGLFQRFIPIVADVEYVEANENPDSHASIKSELFQPFSDASELDSDGNPVSVPSIQAGTRTRMPFSPAAHARFKELQREYRHRQINASRDLEQSDTAGLYSRLSEQVERVATVLATDEITIEVLNYAITFLETRHKAIMAVANDTILKGKGSDNVILGKRVLQAITRYCSENNVPEAPRGDIWKKVRTHFAGGPKQFEQTIVDCKEAGELDVVSGCKKPGKNSKPFIGLRLADVI